MHTSICQQSKLGYTECAAKHIMADSLHLHNHSFQNATRKLIFAFIFKP